MLAEPEPWDDSEEQFESSLTSSEQPDCYRSIALGPSERTPEISAEDPQFARLDRRERRAQLDRDLSNQAEVWRDTLSSKLDQYRNRRGKERLAGQFTMSLDFERSTHRAVMSATAPAIEPDAEFEAQHLQEFPAEPTAPAGEREIDVPGPAGSPFTVSEGQEEAFQSFGKVEVTPVGVSAETQELALAPAKESPRPAASKRKRPERKVIQFPRLMSVDPPAANHGELAESMLGRPRIMDVPEETQQIELPLGGISLQPAHEEVAVPRQEIEIPIQVAGVSQRVFAGIADNVLILVATAVFAGIVLNFANEMPHNKLVLIVALVVPALFWTMYHYLFLVHAATTPGMLMARIRLATFEGTRTNRNIRRVRALAMLISCLSAGLGFAWALVDEDTLCWHDKISRTYLANR